MMRQQLERRQVWVYLVAVLLGLAAGEAMQGVPEFFEATLWPLLGLLVYATFAQAGLTQLPEAFRDRSFIGAVLVGNFVLMPLVVWGLLAFLPDDPAIRLGVSLVLLAPCTDWYVAFTHLGGGDVRRAIAATPVNLLAQLATLPAYLWLFMGDAFLESLAADRIALAFVGLIVLPLLGAWLTERRAARSPIAKGLVARLGWLPVPLLAAVLFLIAASQAQAVSGSPPALVPVLGVFVAFLVAAALVGAILGRATKLGAGRTRALIFSLGTRNSFVMLPLALALGPEWRTATIVIVLQSFVELFGMIAYLWLVPKLLAPSPTEGARPPPS